MKDHRTASLGLARRGRVAAILCAALLALLGLAVPARAEINLDGPFVAELLDGVGNPQTQAGSHPDRFVTSFRFTTVTGPDMGGNGAPDVIPDEKVKDVIVELPPGLAGSANGAPVCSNELFGSALGVIGGPCPNDTIVGKAELGLGIFGDELPLAFPVFNLEPGPDQAARFGFRVLFPPVNVISSIRSESDYGLTSSIFDTNQGAGLYESTLTLFGVPADHNGVGDPNSPDFGMPGSGPRKWLLRLPTSCGGDIPVRLKVNSYEDPGDVKTFPATLPGPTGCEAVPFDPSVSVEPQSRRADSPSGYDIHIKLPQSDDPDQLGTADLKDAVVTLPPGVSISPSAAGGLESCTDAQVGAGTKNPMSCPDASKVGAVTVDTPSLPKPLVGGLYLGQQQPGDTFRLFLHAERSGVELRLTTSFEDNPQLPFSDLHLSFFGGPRAVLANPSTCGTKTATAELTSHSGAVKTASHDFSIDQAADGGPCSGSAPFAPSLVAGSTNPIAGAFSPFVLRVGRNDGDQELSSLSVDLPAGFTAQVAGVPLCADANAAAGTCGAGSRVGSVVVGAGPGANPVDVPGTAYLAGPYKGAPFSLVFVVPAKVGPIDLGTVIVRAAVRVDTRDAHLTVVADPLPTIVGGVPLRMRSLTVRIDRDQFAINPTSCAEKQVVAAVGSTTGGSALPSIRYQVGDCAALRFRPRMRLQLTGRNQMTRERHPGLVARLRQGAGQAHLRAVGVTLPVGLSLDIDTLPDPCTREQLAALACPDSARVGTARAVTSLLDAPLSGPVYLVAAAPGASLPGLATILRGQITIVIEGITSFGRRGLTSRFGPIPDVPLSAFTLRLRGGANGILTPTRANLCDGSLRGRLVMRGQNGASRSSRPKVAAPCRRR
jgi:hypothetical protein